MNGAPVPADERCPKCHGTGWTVRHYYVCDCRAGDHAWAKWEGMTIEEYDARAEGLPGRETP